MFNGDYSLVNEVLEDGAPGVLQKDVAKLPALVKYGLRYYDVSRQIVRMNNHLLFETGKLLFEKRGHKWSLTSFAFEVWGETQKA